MSRERFLADAFEDQLGPYDVVLLDCPPQLGTLRPNGLFSASEVVIPTAMTDRGAYKGAAELMAKVDQVRRHHRLRISALVRTEVDRRPGLVRGPQTRPCSN
jgi:cellulose biosynthesis protein BcsQ